MINFLWIKKLNILEIMIAAGSIFEKNGKYCKQLFTVKKSCNAI